MFEKFKFSGKQIDNYYRSAIRDLKIASRSDLPEVAFRFSYDALLKLSIAVCVEKGLRVKARRGHHVELIKKLSVFLEDEEVEVLANEMRAKRNWDLYSGGVLISSKEASSYVKWVREIFKKADKVFHTKQPRLKL